MGRVFQVTVSLAAVLVTLLSTVTFTTAEEIEVGGVLGWTVPSNPTAYSDWASTQTFHVGDVLVFSFTTGIHSVAEVLKKSYDNCDASQTLQIIQEGPANITLTIEGDMYFLCTFPGHCINGQKLAIMVTASDAAAPPPVDQATTPPPPPPPAPEPSPTPPPLELAPPAPASPPTKLPKNNSPSVLDFTSLVQTMIVGFLAVAMVMF